jgi:Dynein heavy chain, N-terminal region 1
MQNKFITNAGIRLSLINTRVRTALSEASAVAKNLGALERYSEAFVNTDLPEAASGPLKCLLHIICLVWANCPQYRRSSRLVTLLRQVSNLLIQQVRGRERDNGPRFDEKYLIQRAAK